MRARKPATAGSFAVLSACALSLALLPAGPLRAAPEVAAPPAPLSATDTPPSPPKGRLPDAVTPRAYRLDLTVNPAAPRFSGHVAIEAELNASSRFIYLHGRDLVMHRATARSGGHTMAGTWQQVSPTGLALLTFPAAVPAGPVTFSFDYDTAMQDGPAGLFHVKVGDDWYAWSQFESIDARSAYPGFDQPGYKQPFILTLRTPAGLAAVSNAPETGVTHEGGLDVHHFAATPPLPTYLLAMMVGPFAIASGAVPPTPQRDHPLPLRIISTRPNAGQLSFALAGTVPIITALEAYFGQSFPYPKLDQITAPIMPGAMENAGADLYEDSLLVLDDNATTAQKRDFGMVVSHELSHQWFGDLVTPAWWDDIWLNESFANWMGYRIGNQWRPDLHIADGALAEGFAAMNTDALLAGRPIHQPITQDSQIDAAFDSITYGKGGQVVAMIAGFMGDDLFRDGVRRYMAAHRYGNGTSAEFFGAMAQASGDARLLPAMQGFTDQQGVPLLTFAGHDGHYTVTQSRYARLGTPPPPTHWSVPMCLRRGDVRQCRLLDTPSAEIALDAPGPLMPNAGGTGYYRFELAPAEWHALIETSATLPGGEALALADSLRASFLAGRASAADLARLAEVMTANPDSHASDTALAGLEQLDSWGLLNAQADKSYRHFVGRLYRPLLARYGFDPRANAYATQDAETTERRAQIVSRLATIARDEPLRRQLLKAARRWMAGDTAALDPAWYTLALPVWLDEVGQDGAWRRAARQMLDTALASQDPLLRPAALHALGASGRVEIARWLLNEVKDDRLRAPERLHMVGAIAAAPGTATLGYGWMRDNLAELLKGGGGIFFASRLPQVLAGLCSVESADAIAHDFGPSLAGKTAQLELDRTVERVRDCGRLKSARSAEASADIAKLR